MKSQTIFNIVCIVLAVAFSIAALVLSTVPVTKLSGTSGAAMPSVFTILNGDERRFKLYTCGGFDGDLEYDRIATKHGRRVAEIDVPAVGTTRRIGSKPVCLEMYSRNFPLKFEVKAGDVLKLTHADSRRTGKHVIERKTSL